MIAQLVILDGLLTRGYNILGPLVNMVLSEACGLRWKKGIIFISERTWVLDTLPSKRPLSSGITMQNSAPI